MVFGYLRTALLFVKVLLLLLLTEVPGECFVDPARSSTYECRCGSFVLEADFIIWRPFEKGLEHCSFDEISNEVLSNGTVSSIIKNTDIYSNFRWSPGFRIGVGYERINCGWIYGVEWTHLNSTLHRSLDENRIRWNLNFDTVDAFGAYEASWLNCLSIIPFAGIRGAKIDQRFHIKNSVADRIHNKDRQNFWGVGPLIGVEALYKIDCNLSVYADVDFSWLYGDYHVRLDDFSQFDGGILVNDTKSHFYANQYLTDAAIGIQWSPILWGYSTCFRLGIEHHHYFDYNYLGDGDLILNGAILSIGSKF